VTYCLLNSPPAPNATAGPNIPIPDMRPKEINAILDYLTVIV